MLRYALALVVAMIVAPAMADYSGPSANVPFGANGLPNAVSTPSLMLARTVSIDDAVGIHHDGVTDDTAVIQTLLNSVAAAGGGNVLVGPHQYAIQQSPISSLQITSAQYNTSGFTIVLPSVSGYYVGQSVTLVGFSSPLSPMNGTWQISYVNPGNPGNVVVLTSAMGGTQSNTTTGIGTVYENITIPSNVVLECPKSVTGFPPANTPYSQMPYTFLTGSYSTFLPQQNSGIFGCNIVNDVVANVITNGSSVSNTRQKIVAQQAFLGTAITISNASDVELEKLTIVGYNIGVSSYYGARGEISHLRMDDNQCIYTDNSHAPSHYSDVDCGDYATGGGNDTPSWAITNIGNNGSGLWRVTTSGASTIIVGDTVYVAGVSGAGSANNTWTVAATDGSSYVDLAGSVSGGTSSYMVSTTSQSYCLKSFSGTATQMSAIGVGDSITGANIPASTTVTDVLPIEKTICMSNQASANATNITITTTPQAYSSGGNIYLDADNRLGYGYSWTNGETNTCTDCSVGSHSTGFYIGAGAAWTTLTNVKADNYLNEKNKGSVCFQVDSSANGTDISGGSTNSCWIGFLGTSTNTNQAHIVTGIVINASGRTIELSTGRYTLFGNTSGFGAPLNFVGDSIGSLGYGMNDLAATWELQSGIGMSAINPIGNTFSGTNVYQGNVTLHGDVAVGGGGTYCPQFSQCGVTTRGQFIDASASTGGYNSYYIPGTAGSWLYTGSSTVSSYTIQLPSPTNGAKLNIAFQQAITTAAWASGGSGTVSAPYTSISAGQIVFCEAWSTAWYCK